MQGNEDDGYIAAIRREVSNRIIKAIRVRNDEILKPYIIRQFIKEPGCDYFLFDTYVKNIYGGSGKSFDWTLIPKTCKPFFLSGGINLLNAVQAIRACRPYCLDVSSGVETCGVKDPEKIRELVTLIRNVR
jgi:phosphoribosylanthranilate isomerase